MENKEIMLSGEERKELEKFTRTGVHSVRLVNRARVILALDRAGKQEHLRITRICDAIGISRQALYNIKRDFHNAASIASFLTRKKRETPPVPKKITGDVQARIIALACSVPPDGHARWTVRLLRDRVIELEYLPSVSHTSIHALLKKRI